MEVIPIVKNDISKYHDNKFYDVYRCVRSGKWWCDYELADWGKGRINENKTVWKTLD